MEQRSHSFEASSEHSGWTAYLRDFSKDNDGRDEEGDDFSSSYCSSLVSDAASHVRRTLPNLNKRIMKAPKRVNSMKKMTRTHEVVLENPLEDTASSHVNSPRAVDRSKPRDVARINPRFENKCRGISSEQSGVVGI